jgi:hypothetical protein
VAFTPPFAALSGPARPAASPACDEQRAPDTAASPAHDEIGIIGARRHCAASMRQLNTSDGHVSGHVVRESGWSRWLIDAIEMRDGVAHRPALLAGRTLPAQEPSVQARADKNDE